MLSIIELSSAFARAPRSLGRGAGVFSRSVSEPVRLAELYGGEEGARGESGLRGAEGPRDVAEPEDDDGAAEGLRDVVELKAAESG